MRGAIVRAFRRVFKVGRVLRHQALEKFFQIAPRCRIRIFHDDEATAGMPNEYGDGPANQAGRANGRFDIFSDLVCPFAAGRDRKVRGVDAHHRRPR